jgi:general secretion pathway protein A
MTALYAEHFGLTEAPFSLAPDPRYLYASEQHREALAHLIYGVRSEGGFVLLTGEVGTGKTTIFRCLLERLPEKTKIAFVIHPSLSVVELLATVCDEFGILYPPETSSTKAFVDLLNTYLLDINSRGIHAVLVIDEAQSLDAEVLEQLRLLTNLETNRHKLLQIILLGQPELREMLARPDMKQLAQRVTARYHLGPLPKGDVGPYIGHRLTVAGCREAVFGPEEIALIYRWSGGVPRVINLICDRALLGAFSQGSRTVTRAVLKQASLEVLGEKGGGGVAFWKWAAAVSVLLAGGVVFFLVGTPRESDPPAATAVMEEAPPVPEPAAPPVVKAVPREEVVSSREEEVTRGLEWLFGEASSGTRGTAEGILLALWGDRGRETAGGEMCERAEEIGLRCLTASGGLGDLKKLNRPALLRIVDVEGGHFYSVLTGLEGEKATLRFKDGSGEVRLRWFGEYTLLWQPPPGYSRALAPGGRGKTVDWLRLRMGEIRGRALKGRTPERYDEALEAEVRAFQGERGIEVDGIIGPRTIIELNTAGGGKVPTLYPPDREG